MCTETVSMTSDRSHARTRSTTSVTAANVRDGIRARYTSVAQLVLDSLTASPSSDEDLTTGSTPSAVLGVVETSACFGPSQYSAARTRSLPRSAVAASVGCGDPLETALVRPGQRVLDLGCGGGIDALLIAPLVGPEGMVVGLDMTAGMLQIARQGAAEADVGHVRFVQGLTEELPVADSVIDLVTSNGTINLSADKLSSLREMYRVLRPPGAIHLLDVVAEDRLSMAERLDRTEETGCTVGALSRREYLDLLALCGFWNRDVEFQSEIVDGMHSAVIRAVKSR